MGALFRGRLNAMAGGRVGTRRHTRENINTDAQYGREEQPRVRLAAEYALARNPRKVAEPPERVADVQQEPEPVRPHPGVLVHDEHLVEESIHQRSK